MKFVAKLKLNFSQNDNYVIEVVRSNRKTLTLKVNYDGTITLKCPKYFSVSDIDKLILKKRVWIENSLTLNKRNFCKYEKVFNYNSVLIDGVERELKFSNVNSFNKDVIYVKNVKLLKELLVENCFGEFKRLCVFLSKKCGLSFNQVSVKSYTRVWGTCDTHKNLGFNFRIFMLPKNLQEYVIIHELCHTIYMNHSRNFKNLLQKCCPNTKYCENQLFDFSFLTELY